MNSTRTIRDCVNRSVNWKAALRPAFVAFGVIREGSEGKRSLSDADIENLRRNFANPSVAAQKFADTLLVTIEGLGRKLKQEIFILEHIVIAALPGSSQIQDINAIIFGFVRSDGAVRPIVVDPNFVLVQFETGMSCTRYDLGNFESTMNTAPFEPRHF